MAQEDCSLNLCCSDHKNTKQNVPRHSSGLSRGVLSEQNEEHASDDDIRRASNDSISEMQAEPLNLDGHYENLQQ